MGLRKCHSCWIITSINYTFGEDVDFLLCLNYIYAFKNYLKKKKEVIFHLKFAMYMHLSHIPKMCYTCDIS